MKHFTFSLFGKEIFSFTWGDVLVITDEEPEQFVRLGGEFDVADVDPEAIEQAVARIPFGFGR